MSVRLHLHCTTHQTLLAYDKAKPIALDKAMGKNVHPFNHVKIFLLYHESVGMWQKQLNMEADRPTEETTQCELLSYFLDNSDCGTLGAIKVAQCVWNTQTACSLLLLFFYLFRRLDPSGGRDTTHVNTLGNQIQSKVSHLWNEHKIH